MCICVVSAAVAVQSPGDTSNDTSDHHTGGDAHSEPVWRQLLQFYLEHQNPGVAQLAAALAE